MSLPIWRRGVPDIVASWQSTWKGVTAVASCVAFLAFGSGDVFGASVKSCAVERGSAARRLVRTCRDVSPATHPPCNAANSCAMIEDEIARTCALFADDHSLPVALCQPSPRSKEASAAVVRLYYSALNARDYGTAWQQWGAYGIPDQTLERFAKGFAKTRSTHVTIGQLPSSEGGAGSIYQDVPVVIEAVQVGGARQRFAGAYQLRRVNGVDRATPDQLRWHIFSAHLKRVR